MSLVNTLLADRYRIERLLARGGMADVYLATDERLERKVAVKVIYPHLAENPSFRDKFIREAKTAARLNHPNLVNVFDQGTDGATTYLVMEYVAGMTLRDAMQKFGKLKPGRALELFDAILQGLAAAHRAGVLHRDLKPENVFLADDGRIKLGDFGLARDIDANTNTGSLVGTIAYLSPELITRGVADARSDVYALGIMLYEFLTGEQPFKGNEIAHIAHQHTAVGVPAPSLIEPTVPPIVDELVLWSTAKAPEHRPANAQVLMEVTERVRAELKAGRGATSRLDLPQFAKMAATTVIPVDSTLVLDFPSTDATTVIGADATAVIGGETAGTAAFGPNATTVISADETELPLSPLEELGNRRRKNGKWIALAITVFALLSLGAGWWFGSGPGGLTTLPNLASTTLANAQESLRPYAAKVSVEHEHSKTISAGLVTRSQPGAGSLFWRGAAITLWVSDGPELKAVPSLAGLSVAQATAKLTSAGFIAGTTSEYFSTGAKGTVFGYPGIDGKTIAAGSTIPLQVSLGPIPDVAGSDQATAINLLQAAGIKVSATTLEYSDAQPDGKAIRAELTTTPLPVGGSVVLVMSKGGTTVVMPNMIGETLAATKLALENLGLQVYVNTDQLQANWGVAKVRSVSVAAGSVIKRGTTVTISNKK